MWSSGPKICCASIRRRPRPLAEDTGGFLVRDTNDLGSAFRRIDEDNRFHYLLTYSPKNEHFDGKFRTIGSRCSATARRCSRARGTSRCGRAGAGTELRGRRDCGARRCKPPNAFAIGAAAMVFPEPAGKTLVPIVVQVQTNQLHSRSNQEKGTYAAQAAVVASIKDARGETVLTLSQQYILTGKEGTGRGEGGRNPVLSPGGSPPRGVRARSHRVRCTGRARSARLSTINVPAASRGRLAASSLVLVRRTEQVPPAERAPNLPFYYGDRLLTRTRESRCGAARTRS